MFWDPEVESPATIAVIGAGPVGIEAALYARFLGYDVDIFDTGRPARNATRWHRRALGVAVGDCTSSLGHAALRSQDPDYQPPASDRPFTGQEFADEYLIPLAKSDLLVDGVHINSRVVEISRLRTSLDDLSDLQERCNDEFRLLIESRDRGFYTRRADIILDCRGAMGGTCGWGPGGSQSIGATDVSEHVHRWLPRDPRFELRTVQGRQTILFGQSETAILFAQEWSDLLEGSDAPEIAESLRQLAPVALNDPHSTSPGGPALDLRLLWLIPNLSLAADTKVAQIAAQLAAKQADPKRFSVLPIVGIERVVRDANGRWSLELLQSDDSTVELSADTFAPFPNLRRTPCLGHELLSQEFAFLTPPSPDIELERPTFLNDWPGWKVATHEPHYYRLGCIRCPRAPQALNEAYRQIRDLFALLGTRADLNLYDIIEEA